MARKPKQPKNVETLKHEEARRAYIPTAEFESVMAEDEKNPIRVACTRARDHLLVTGVDPASEFLDDMLA